MPERTPTAKPTIMAGTVLESGTPNTGQVMFSEGGTKLHSVFSGTAGGDANVWVGGGRLDAGFFMGLGSVLALSGQEVSFYDSAVAVSGGPLATSGHKVIGTLTFPASQASTASGNVFKGGGVQNFGFPFSSGLCYASRSGQLGWSITYTPVISG